MSAAELLEERLVATRTAVMMLAVQLVAPGPEPWAAKFTAEEIAGAFDTISTLAATEARKMRGDGLAW